MGLISRVSSRTYRFSSQTLIKMSHKYTQMPAENENNTLNESENEEVVEEVSEEVVEEVAEEVIEETSEEVTEDASDDEPVASDADEDEEESSEESSSGDEEEEEEDEDEEEEVELVDVFLDNRKLCEQTPKCVSLKEELDKCEERVNSRTETLETCTEELFEFIHERDHCTTKYFADSFVQNKSRSFFF